MSLGEIKDKLYKKDADPNLSQHEKSEFDPRNETASAKNVRFDANDAWVEKEAFLSGKEEKSAIKKGLLWLGIVLGIIVLLVAVFQVRKSSFDESNVAINIDGPDEARSGELVSYEINYVNNNWGSLENAVLRINHPESFRPEDGQEFKKESPSVSLIEIGKIEGHASKKVFFSGKAYSPKGTLIYLKAEMMYKPLAFSSDFASKRQIGINITSTPIKLEVEAPFAIASGNAIDYEINYKNEGENEFENLKLKADFPEGFVFSGSNPGASDGNNVWQIGSLKPGASGKIVISGSLQGDRDTYRIMEVHLGSMDQGQFVAYNDEKASTKITASPLTIWQTVNGSADLSVNPGDMLKFKIYYKNEGDLRLRNVIVKESLDSSVLDYATLKAGGGSFDEGAKTIEWKASDHPKLALLNPGDEGFIEFFIGVKQLIPVETVNDNNFTISSVARIDSPDIPTPIEMNKIVVSNRKDLKLNTKLILDVKGFYKSSLIENFGPIPPKVGEETSYAIHIKVGNVSNKVSDAKVEIVLPTGVTMTGKKIPENVDLQFNERTNALTWNVGNVEVGEGIISPYREIVFQIKIKPSSNQKGEAVDIVQSVVLSGKDTFTGQDLTVSGGGKNIMLLEDQYVKEHVPWNVQ